MSPPTSDRPDDVIGVIIVDHGSRRQTSNQAFEQFVDRVTAKTGWSIVEAAHMELATPTIGSAFDRCVKRGATHMVICPFFLMPGRHWHEDIPAQLKAASEACGGIPFTLTHPVGLDPMMAQIVENLVEPALEAISSQHRGGVGNGVEAIVGRSTG